jgi:hypothetical protein
MAADDGPLSWKDLNIGSFTYSAPWPDRKKVARLAEEWVESSPHTLVLRPGKAPMTMVRPRNAHGRYMHGWRACFELLVNGSFYVNSHYLTIEPSLHDIRVAVW